MTRWRNTTHLRCYVKWKINMMVHRKEEQQKRESPCLSCAAYSISKRFSIEDAASSLSSHVFFIYKFFNQKSVELILYKRNACIKWIYADHNIKNYEGVLKKYNLTEYLALLFYQVFTNNYNTIWFCTFRFMTATRLAGFERCWLM